MLLFLLNAPRNLILVSSTFLSIASALVGS
jgi:hypothetical protein